VHRRNPLALSLPSPWGDARVSVGAVSTTDLQRYSLWLLLPLLAHLHHPLPFAHVLMPSPTCIQTGHRRTHPKCSFPICCWGDCGAAHSNSLPLHNKMLKIRSARSKLNYK
jgi:hypothetical protein